MPRNYSLSRRSLLAGLGGTAVARFPLLRSFQAGLQAQADSDDPRMIVYSREYLTMEMRMQALTDWITPTNTFFVRNNLIMPSSIDIGQWQLRITGEVKQPLTINFRDLNAFPRKSVINTLECAGNGRAYYSPRIGGVPWRRGAVGNAAFEGPALRDVLRHTKLKSTAKHVAFIGLDTPPAGSERFIRSIPIDKALEENTLIATHMNGAALTVAHGFPARALVPGWIGSASIKWLQEIVVLEREFKGAYMDPGYRVPASQATDHIEPDKPTQPLTSLRLKSVIAFPNEDSSTVRGNETFKIRGAAWAGEKRISAVEVSTDAGLHWEPAKLNRDHAKYAWRLWELDWTPESAGSYTLMSRAIDDAGNRQPENPAWNGGGYLWNGYDRFTVEVTA